ncbi:TRAP transporter permease [Nocardiopsis sp. NPDC058631]|uniref:TRAP transporter permease n=1 Tax=Nocardiopsis sp. NPDC058631 TaxID=3346566 RepID=UPI003663C185
MAETPPQARGGTSPSTPEPGEETAAEGAATGDRPGTQPGPRAGERPGSAADVLPDVDGEEEGADPVWKRLAAERWGQSRMAGIIGVVILALAVGLTLFQLYIGLVASMDARQQRVIHLMFVLVLVFLVRPVTKGAFGRSAPGIAIDLALIAAALAASLYPLVYQQELASRVGAYNETDWIMGAIMVVLLLEATRRTVGMVMVLLAAVFLFYAWIGPLIPGDFGHSGRTYQRISTYSYLGTEAIFGMTLGVVVTFVFVFILFGALLQKTGGGNFFVGLAYCLTGRMVGGPAKAAVLGSALMGSVSGSAIANVVTTGVFTIPLMKKVGYKKHDAAGVEAAASTGGQILPPIMGAGAFLMAEYIGVPYADIVKVAIIPALMYFGVMFFFVDILARKNGIGGMSAAEVPTFRAVLAAGWHFLAPLLLLIVLLLNYVTPTQAGLYSCGVLLVVAMVRASSRLSLRDFLEVFVIAANNTLPVSIACATAGIIVGVVSLTGMGLAFSSMMLSVGAGNLFLTLVMIALASLVLGMGLPVTASYVVVVILAGPALQELGVALIVAHMIVYWLSQDSNVTPPVALAAFAAAGVANASPMRSGVSSWKFAKGLYLIPLLMAYSSLMALDGPVLDVVVAVVSGCVALAASAIAIEGFFLRRTLLGERLLLAVAALLVLVAPEWAALVEGALSTTVDPQWFVLAGSVVGAALIALQVVGHRRAKAVARTVPEDGGGAPAARDRSGAPAGK